MEPDLTENIPSPKCCPQKTNPWKITALFFLLLFATSLSVVFYLFIKKPVCPAAVCDITPLETNVDNEFVSWPTFESKKYAIGFLYRPDLIVNESNQGDWISLQQTGPASPLGLLLSATIKRIGNPTNTTPRDYALNELCKPALEMTNRPESSPEESYKFCQKWVTDNLKPYEPTGIIKGFETVYALGEGETWVYIFPHNDKLYVVKGSEELDIPQELGMATLKTIIKTFTFLD